MPFGSEMTGVVLSQFWHIQIWALKKWWLSLCQFLTLSLTLIQILPRVV